MRLIDADALIERIKYSFSDNERVRIDMVTGTFLTEYCSPTVDAEPVRHGKWIEHDGKTWCSLCDASNKAYKPPFCPHCGARMDEEGSR